MITQLWTCRSPCLIGQNWNRHRRFSQRNILISFFKCQIFTNQYNFEELEKFWLTMSWRPRISRLENTRCYWDDLFTSTRSHFRLLSFKILFDRIRIPNILFQATRIWFFENSSKRSDMTLKLTNSKSWRQKLNFDVSFWWFSQFDPIWLLFLPFFK